MSNLIVGIDPGVNGAFAVIEKGRPVLTVKMPKDIMGMRNAIFRLAALDTIWCVEKVQPRPSQSLKGVITSCVNWGILQAILHMSYGRVIYVTPQEWQKTLGLNRNWDRPKGMSDEKWSSFKYSQRKKLHKDVAIEMFPDIKVTFANADALLIAEYCRVIHTDL